MLAKNAREKRLLCVTDALADLGDAKITVQQQLRRFYQAQFIAIRHHACSGFPLEQARQSRWRQVARRRDIRQLDVSGKVRFDVATRRAYSRINGLALLAGQAIGTAQQQLLQQVVIQLGFEGRAIDEVGVELVQGESERPRERWR